MAGVSLRNSPLSPFSECAGVSEILRSPYRGEGGFRRKFPEGFRCFDLFGLEQQQADHQPHPQPLHWWAVPGRAPRTAEF